MTHIKVWSRCDWGTWALPLYVTHLSYDNYGMQRYQKLRRDHIVSIRVLCFGFFVEWSR
jgi:hypothetical protein